MLKYLDTLHYSAATFVRATDVGSLTVECTHHYALNFPGDRPGACCKNGKVNLAAPSLRTNSSLEPSIPDDSGGQSCV